MLCAGACERERWGRGYGVLERGYELLQNTSVSVVVLSVAGKTNLLQAYITGDVD